MTNGKFDWHFLRMECSELHFDTNMLLQYIESR